MSGIFDVSKLTVRDLIAIALSGGYKLAGGNTMHAFLLGIGVRLVMQYLDFPAAHPITAEECGKVMPDFLKPVQGGLPNAGPN